MSSTHHRHIFLVTLPVLLALVIPLLSPAQTHDHSATAPSDSNNQMIQVYVGEPGRNKVPIAVPSPNAAASVDTQQFFQVLTQDLNLSGWVDIIDPDAYIEPSGTSVYPGQFNYDDWSITGAVGLAKTGLAAAGQTLRGELWVYDVPGERKLGAKAFTTTSVRALAHKIASEIIFQLTGKPGPFNTRFAVVNKATGNKEIYVMDFDGHNPRRITNNGSINLQPSWNSGGNKIAFTSYMNGNPDLYVADLAAGRITRISARSGINTGASWSPTQGLLALTLSPSGNPDIFTIDAQSGLQIGRLTRTLR